MISIWRREVTWRLRADDLLQKTMGGESQNITAEFWEVETQGGERIALITRCKPLGVAHGMNWGAQY